MSLRNYELFVIGSGPTGEWAAIQAAKLKKSVRVTDRRTVVDGMCINTGAISIEMD